MTERQSAADTMRVPRLPKRLRYQEISAEARNLLAAEGESGRFEFKQTDDAVDARVLVAAANATALDQAPAGYVTILVGVKEVEDETTGVVRGEVIGLTKMNDATARRKSLDKARQRIQSRASETKPVPVGLLIIEEATETPTPFLRLIVYPTRIPHYTNDGLRVTRYGASTRAITDEELVDMYLDREAEAFRRRFSEIAAGLEDSVRRLRESVNETSAGSAQGSRRKRRIRCRRSFRRRERCAEPRDGTGGPTQV